MQKKLNQFLINKLIIHRSKQFFICFCCEKLADYHSLVLMSMCLIRQNSYADNKQSANVSICESGQFDCYSVHSNIRKQLVTLWLTHRKLSLFDCNLNKQIFCRASSIFSELARKIRAEETLLISVLGKTNKMHDALLSESCYIMNSSQADIHAPSN